MDHLAAGILVLAADRYAAVPVQAWMEEALVTVIRGSAALWGEPGDLVSLLPVGGSARGVTTAGLRYPLRDDDLPPGTTRGISNVLVDGEARVEVRDGVLLAIQPTAQPTAG